MIEANRRYVVKVKSACVSTSQKGTLGISLRFACADGEISHTLWLTEGARPFTTRNLETLGADSRLLGDPLYLKAIGAALTNEVEITTAEDVYAGEGSVKVQFINPVPADAGDLLSRAAEFFGVAHASEFVDTTQAVTPDNDSVPF